MPRQAGSNIPNIENIEYPNLTDNTQQNFQTVMNNSLKNFENASSALASQAQANNAEYQMRAREESQKGGGILSDIGEFGKSLTAGYLLLEEMKSRKAVAKQQAAKEAYEMGLKEREMGLKEQEYIGKEERRVQDVYIRALEGEIASIETEVTSKIASTSASEGLQFWDTAVSSITQSEYWKLLSPESKVDIVSKLQERKNSLFKEQLSEVTDERKKLESEQVNAQFNGWYQVNVGRLEKIRSGSGAYSDEEISQDLNNIETSLQEYITKNDVLFSNKTYALQFYNRALQEISGSIKAYYGDTYNRNSEAARFVQAADQLAALDIARQIPQEDGGITEGQFQVEAKRALISLGLETEPDKFPTSQRASLEREITDLKNIKEYRELVAQDRNVQSILGDDTPQGQLYNRALVGKYLFNGINTKGIASLKQDLNYLMKNSPAEAQRMQADSILSLANEFEPDVKQWSELNKEFLKLEQKAASLGYNPPAREYIMKPGDPNVTVGADGKLSMEYQTAPEIVLLERPGGGVPSNSPEEIESVKKQMEQVEHQRRVLLWKWGQYGIDISNPSNPTLIEKLGSEAKEVEMYVKGKSAENNINSYVDPNNFAPTETDDDKTSRAVAQSVTYEVKQNKILTQFHPVGAFESVQQKDLVASSYQLMGSEIINLTLQGKDDEVKKRIDSYQDTVNKDLEQFGVKPIDAEQAARVQKSLRQLQDWTKSKRNWYRNKLGQQSRSNEPPVNFTSGSSKNNAGTVTATPPRNEAPMRPSIPLKGSLAVWEGGYAPFKSGNVTMTSDFRSSSRPDHSGIDISSTDPRVASLQGGKVKWTGNWGDYGNVVFVETGDGHIEMFAHLSKINVKQGQIVNPADVVGVMGSTGRSTGPHLHFEVWTNGNWTDPRSAKRGTINPHEYLRAFQGKTELPTVTGGMSLPNSDQGKGVRYHTGAFRLSNGLLYVNGYIIDSKTGQSRKATATEYEASKSARPVYKVVHNSLTEEVTTNLKRDGQIESYTYAPPQEAYKDPIFMYLRPAGYKDKSGRDVYNLEAYQKQSSQGGKHVRLFSKPVISGGGVPSSGQRPNRSYQENLSQLDKRNWSAQDKQPIKKIILSVGHSDWSESAGSPGEEALNRAVAQKVIQLAPQYGLSGKIELHNPSRKYSNAELRSGQGTDSMGDYGSQAEREGAYTFEIHHNVREKDFAANPIAGNTSGQLSGVIPGVGGSGVQMLDELLAQKYGRFQADHRGGLRSPKKGVTILELGATQDITDEYVEKKAKELLSVLSQAQFEGQGQPISDGNYKLNPSANGFLLSNGTPIEAVNSNEQQVVNAFLQKNRNAKLYVRTTPTGVVRNAPPRSSNNRPVNLKGSLSIHRKDYNSLGSPEDDYGYAVLKNHPKIRQALYNAAVALDVPMVWIADQLIRESNFDPTVPSPSKQHRGIFQIDIALWSRVLGFDSSIFRPGEANVIKQIELYTKYIKWYEKHEINKKVTTFEELLLCVWGSGSLVKKYISNPNAFSTTDHYVYWNHGKGREDYRQSVGKRGGRRYQWTGNLKSDVSHVHDAPRGNCTVCNSMMRQGTFNSHFA